MFQPNTSRSGKDSSCTFGVFVISDPVPAHQIALRYPDYAQLFADVSPNAPTCLYCNLLTITDTPFPEVTVQVARRHAALDFWEDRLALYFSQRRRPLSTAGKNTLIQIARNLCVVNKKTGWVPDFLELKLFPIKSSDLDELWMDTKKSMLLFEIEKLFRPKK